MTSAFEVTASTAYLPLKLQFARLSVCRAAMLPFEPQLAGKVPGACVQLSPNAYKQGQL